MGGDKPNIAYIRRLNPLGGEKVERLDVSPLGGTGQPLGDIPHPFPSTLLRVRAKACFK